MKKNKKIIMSSSDNKNRRFLISQNFQKKFYEAKICSTSGRNICSCNSQMASDDQPFPGHTSKYPNGSEVKYRERQRNLFRRLVKVKICGITNKEDAVMAVNAGADVIGAVVDVPVESPRKITIEKAGEIFSSVPVFVSTVAVIMPQNIEEVVGIVNKANPDIIQLQGYETPEFASEIKNKIQIKIIKVIHIEDGGNRFDKQNINEIVNEIKDYENAGACAVVLDTKTKSGIGGTGRVHNWELSKIINESIDIPLILAGGLNPENVRNAVNLVKPYAVDVSSGVESVLGKKDKEKVKKFIEEARFLLQEF